MTFQVRKSLLVSTDLFDIEVAAFAKEQRDWLEREAKVREELGRNDIAPIDRHHRYPAPSAHPLIMNSVDLETGVPNYEFVNDPLEMRKATLIRQLAIAAHDASFKIISPAKLKAGQIRLADIMAADIERRQKSLKDRTGILEALKFKKVDQSAVDSDVSSLRSEDDNKLVDFMAEKSASLQEIHRKAALAHAEIEDLTEETIDDYKLPTF